MTAAQALQLWEDGQATQAFASLLAAFEDLSRRLEALEEDGPELERARGRRKYNLQRRYGDPAP